MQPSDQSIQMSLVAKYARKYDDDEEEPCEPVVTKEEPKEAVSKKREASEEVASPPAKKLKIAESSDEKLELPDFFKADSASVSSSTLMEVDITSDKSAQRAALVPRQVRCVAVIFTTPLQRTYLTLDKFQCIEAEYCDRRGAGGKVEEGGEEVTPTAKYCLVVHESSMYERFEVPLVTGTFPFRSKGSAVELGFIVLLVRVVVGCGSSFLAQFYSFAICIFQMYKEVFQILNEGLCGGC